MAARLENGSEGRVSSPPALLVIDVQQGLDAATLGARNNPDAESNMLVLMQGWRRQGWPVVHVKHNSVERETALRPESPGNALKAGFEPQPNERLFEKSVNCAFIGTELERHLRESGIEALVVVGLTTDHCVSTTVRSAANRGFPVELVGDATATFERTSINGRNISADEMHEISLTSLNGEFCVVVNTSDVMLSIEAQSA